MKRFVLLFLTGYIQLHAQWYWQAPSPQGGTIFDIHKLNANTFIATGAGATILRSTNGGANWTQQYASNDSITSRLRGIYFKDALTGWVVGSNNLGFSKTIILKTTDGGLTWNSATNGISGTPWDIYFANDNVGYVVGEGGKIFRTTNGGTSWTSMTSGTTNNLFAVWGVSDSVAFAFGIGGAFRTTNQGSTWASYQVVTGAFPNVQNSFFFNRDSGYIVGQGGAMYKTTDKGASWTAIATGSSSSSYDGVYFVNGTHGWITRGSTSLRRTTNSGESWISSNMPISISRSIMFTDSVRGFAFNTFGALYATTDAGATWISSSGIPSADMYQTYFLDKDLGYAVGDGELILKTSNGGGTWTQSKYTGSQMSYESVFFVNSQTGWAGGEGGIMVKTTDGGVTWTPQTSTLFGRIKSIYFRDANNGWISSDNGGGIARTTNGGTIWTKSTITDLMGQSLFEISVPDGKTGLCQGDNIFKTVDSGATWTKLTRITNASGMAMVNTTTAYVSRYIDSLFKTTDAGETWTNVVKNGFTSTMRYIHFEDENHGWGIGGVGAVSRTADGGKTWTAEKLPFTEGPFWNIFAIDSAHAWIAGSYGLIMGKTPRFTTSALTKTKQMPDEFVLSQNFPNPFNPTTSIEFHIPQSGVVKLTVFDIVGREVSTLVNEQLNAGTYRRTFNGVGRASGVYYYRMTVDSYSEIRKMIMLK